MIPFSSFPHPNPIMHLSDLLSTKRIIILDGAMGTELQRQGVDIGLPLWSANALQRAPHVVRNVHFSHLNAGADILTTNTFRSNLRALRGAGMEDRWEELNLKAVQFAHEARERYIPARPVLVAGGLAPVEDCYRPDLVPSDDELRSEHGAQARLLSMLGVDVLLVETMMHAREARIATEACVATGREVMTSFVTREDGALLSGEPLADAARAVLEAGASVLLVNCVSAAHIATPLRILSDIPDATIGCYANIGAPGPETDGVLRGDVDVHGFAEASREWVRLGARFIGGCCGSTPEHLEALARLHSPETLIMQEEEIAAWDERRRMRWMARREEDQE